MQYVLIGIVFVLPNMKTNVCVWTFFGEYKYKYIFNDIFDKYKKISLDKKLANSNMNMNVWTGIPEKELEYKYLTHTGINLFRPL